MKTKASIFLMLAMGTGFVFGQENEAKVDQGVLPVPKQKMELAVQEQSALLNRLFGVNVQTSGVVPMALKSPNPLQLINPLAPPEYGNGFDNTTEDPLSGRPKGISIFGVKF